ncbi:hypothetical protein T484DRAFT_1835035 [Baffinella frigidus]|nr:hypothetical protein T484DRAFT_1835035 [Cryptophyta sp. CCMP2293]
MIILQKTYAKLHGGHHPGDIIRSVDGKASSSLELMKGYITGVENSAVLLTMERGYSTLVKGYITGVENSVVLLTMERGFGGEIFAVTLARKPAVLH